MIGDANLTGASLKYASMNSRQCEHTQSIGPEPRIDVKPTNGAEASLISTRWRLGYPHSTRRCTSRHMRNPSQRTYHPQRLTTPPMTRTLPALAISESAPSITTTPPSYHLSRQSRKPYSFRHLLAVYCASHDENHASFSWKLSSA